MGHAAARGSASLAIASGARSRAAGGGAGSGGTKGSAARGSTGVALIRASRDGAISTSGIASRRVRGSDGSRSSRSEEHTSELQSLMRISYAVFCLKKKNIEKHRAIKHPDACNADDITRH